MSSTAKNGRGKSKASRSKLVSCSTRAGLEFPVGRVAQNFKAGKYSHRVSAEAPVYLTTILEYLAAENGRGKSKASRSKPVSRSKRAGLEFPVGRVAQIFKAGKYSDRVSAEAPVYLTAALEYLAAEVLELAGDKARQCQKRRITPKHIQMAIETDEELSKLLAGVHDCKWWGKPNF
ncbi:histone h2ax [Phtheirospermum japonicum]|uniref:Histone H2A n=1 Tax=Phtheirospermum japonicum TaxID=374723 RepID=A0A830BCC0_9LAMI|nr:histone h2ax [Phtheirospermum japonicum]